MTYQRNIRESEAFVERCFAPRSSRDDDLRATLQNGFDQGLPERIQQAQVAARQDDEAEHDGRALRDLAAVRPLHAAQLVDAVAEEGDEAGAALARASAAAGCGGLLGDDRV